MADEKDVMQAIQEQVKRFDEFKKSHTDATQKNEARVNEFAAQIGEKIGSITDKIDKQNHDLSGMIERVNSLDELITKVKVPAEQVRMDEYLGNLAVGLFAGNKKCLEKARRMNAMGESTIAGGGALVPDQFVPELLKMVEQYGAFRRSARVVPMSGDVQNWPKLAGDVTIYAPGEGGTINASNPTVANVKLVATKLAALSVISSELNEDAAIAVGALVADSMARKLAYTEDACGFLGDGSSTYYSFVGLKGAFAAVHTSAGTAVGVAGGKITATGNLFSEIVIGDLLTMAGAVPTYSDPSAKWYCSKQFWTGVMWRLALGGGGNATADFGVPDFVTSGGKRFLGYPVEIVDVLPKTNANSQYAAYLGDLSMAAFLGDRRSMEMAQSKEAYFTTDQIGIRVTERIAINVHEVGTTTAAGPVVVLEMLNA